MQAFVQISFSDLQPEQRDILIAQLADAGFEGFEETEHGLEAFIRSDMYDKSLLSELAFKYQLPFQEKILEPVNWNQEWESGFSPVVIDDFVRIRAGFHKPSHSTAYELIITPKMSFGTGHHATTLLMIKQMRQLDFKGKSVLDFGTGTGILAILAAKMNALSVWAIDRDEWSINNAAENISKNNCQNIVLLQSDTARVTKTFDIILANINKNVILENLNILCSQLNPTGVLILSGFLAEDREEILSRAGEARLQLSCEMTENNWISYQFHC